MLAAPYKAGFAEWDVMKNREGWLPTKRCTSANEEISSPDLWPLVQNGIQ